MTPALFTRMPRGRADATKRWANASTLSGSARSSRSTCTRGMPARAARAASGARTAATTLAPAPASALVVSSPMPAPPPVTRRPPREGRCPRSPRRVVRVLEDWTPPFAGPCLYFSAPSRVSRPVRPHRAGAPGRFPLTRPPAAEQLPEPAGASWATMRRAFASDRPTVAACARRDVRSSATRRHGAETRGPDLCRLSLVDKPSH